MPPYWHLMAIFYMPLLHAMGKNQQSSKIGCRVISKCELRKMAREKWWNQQIHSKPWNSFSYFTRLKYQTESYLITLIQKMKCFWTLNCTKFLGSFFFKFLTLQFTLINTTLSPKFLKSRIILKTSFTSCRSGFWSLLGNALKLKV